jgi:hypothetical protein
VEKLDSSKALHRDSTQFRVDARLLCVSIELDL